MAPAVQPAVVSIVTSVGLDHTHILGNTVEAIAAEKAGVFRAGGTAVIGPVFQPSVRDVLREAAHQQVPHTRLP